MNKFLKRDHWDKNRGLQANSFAEAMQKAGLAKGEERVITDPVKHAGVPQTPGTDIADPYGSAIKPKNVPVWDHHPANEAEEAIYLGTHIHSESNPLGLHSHVIGGSLSGAHSHGPQNRFGGHHHKKDAGSMSMIDGSHVHEAGRNHPDGEHEHCPENFG